MARPTFEDEMELHRVDRQSSHAMLGQLQFFEQKKKEFANEPIIRPPLVRGDDLIAMGMKPDQRIGEILVAVETRQLEGDFSNREEALQWVKKDTRSLKRAKVDEAPDFDFVMRRQRCQPRPSVVRSDRKLVLPTVAPGTRSGLADIAESDCAVAV